MSYGPPLIQPMMASWDETFTATDACVNEACDQYEVEVEFDTTGTMWDNGDARWTFTCQSCGTANVGEGHIGLPEPEEYDPRDDY